MFSRIIRYAFLLNKCGLFLILSIGIWLPVAHAADESSTVSDGPLGSHVNIESQFANARHLWQSGKLKEAARLYESIIKHHPKLPAPYNNLAVIYAAQGNYKKAQQVLEQGLNTNPSYAMIYENLTAIYVEMARDSYGKALQFVDKSKHQLKLRSLATLSIQKPVQVATVAPPAASVVLPPKPVTPRPVETPKKPVEKKAAAPVPVTTPPKPVEKKVAASASEDKPPVLTDSTSVQPAQATTMTPVAPVVDKTSVEKMLTAWAAAWSAQSPPQYLAYYVPQFHPAGMSRSKWVAQRIRRLKRPKWIRVALSNFVIEPITNQRVRVEVQQRYQSNTYADNERKEFILTQTEQGWRIVSERGL